MEDRGASAASAGYRKAEQHAFIQPLGGVVARAIVLRAVGGPEQLAVESLAVGAPGADQVRLRQSTIGVNYHDVYVRSGQYRTLSLPGVPGIEAVGVIESVGANVARFKPGQRVAYVSSEYGAYADERLIDADRLIGLPDDIDDRTVVSALVKGLTSLMLISEGRRLGPGGFCLIHAAAGGVGRVLARLVRGSGAFVIGTVGSPAKMAAALASGCNRVLEYGSCGFAKEVRELTGGHGVDVAFDSVGEATFLQSLDALAVGGQLVSFGQSSGAIAPFAPSALAAKSNSIWRPVLFHYLADEGQRSQLASQLFAAIRLGTIRPEIDSEFQLADAADAHRRLESRATTGSVLLQARDLAPGQ